ncbi:MULTISPECIES: FHA domain-containing protein [unclassified Streptomyces]|uniref:FHA domain-containing protein n=1 Tax=unclassified Streptomyces TaxID=2593676 RepID=UPI00081DFAFD|nr:MULTISPECIES: FHA domain-containing protein [unclassified Streptomyces]SCF47669.1 FHA domain-containing protein [Streptomyces sp. LcepLS]
MPTCPNGHQSSSDDWCEICGHRMAGSGGPVPPPSPPPAPSPYGYPHSGNQPEAERCPQCGTPRESGGPFCEHCRWNFLTGTATTYVPAAPGSPAGGGFPGPQTHEYQESRPSRINRPPEPIVPDMIQRPAPGYPGQGEQESPSYPGGGSGNHGGNGTSGDQGARPAQGGFPDPYHQTSGYAPGPATTQPPQQQQPPPQQQHQPPQQQQPGVDDWPIAPPAPYPPNGPGPNGPGQSGGLPHTSAPNGPGPQGQGLNGPGPHGPGIPGPGGPRPGDPFAQGPAGPVPGTWSATYGPDREYFLAMMQRSGPEAAGLSLPAYSPEQRVELTGSQITIGRRRHSTGNTPDIDLSVPPEDPGVSHQHAMLTRQQDGTWAVVDQNSTNGTTVNGSEEPIQPFVVQPLSDGDRVHVGAWTTITIHRG